MLCQHIFIKSKYVAGGWQKILDAALGLWQRYAQDDMVDGCPVVVILSVAKDLLHFIMGGRWDRSKRRIDSPAENERGSVNGRQLWRPYSSLSTLNSPLSTLPLIPPASPCTRPPSPGSSARPRPGGRGRARWRCWRCRRRETRCQSAGATRPGTCARRR